MTEETHTMRYRVEPRIVRVRWRRPQVQSTSASWYCTCGGWRFMAVSMPERPTRNNLIEAQTSFARHLVDRLSGQSA